MPTLAEVSQPPLSGDAHVDALLRSYIPWDYTADDIIHFNFTSSASDDLGSYSAFNPFTEAQQAATRLALAHAAAITGIQFVETSDAQLSEMHFGSANLNGFAGLFTFSAEWQFDDSGVVGVDPEGYVYLANTMSGDDFTPGGAAYQILLHEIGHALGLQHPFEGTMELFSIEDDTDRTLMSYTWTGSAKSEFQEYDVAALQWLYGGDGLGGAGASADGAPVQVRPVDNDSMTGTGGHDFLNAGSGSATIIGGEGNDMLFGGSDGDVDLLDGGNGDDRYGVWAGDLLVDPGGVETVYSAATWTLGPGFENLKLYDDYGAGAFDATGNELANIIEGNTASNVINGRAGRDSLTGGPGDDVFVFDQAPGTANADLVTDFSSFPDKVRLDAAVMPALGALGMLAPGDARFWADFGASAGHDADDRLVFDYPTGNLWYDADGSGAGAARLIATLRFFGNAAVIGADDIEIVNSGPAPDPGGEDTVTPPDGEDTVAPPDGEDTVTPPDGEDTVTPPDDVDTIDQGLGTEAADVLIGDASNDSLRGLAGDDSLQGGGGDDTLAGGMGRDTLRGGAGADDARGGKGGDQLYGGADDDFLAGALGADFVRGALGNDSIGGGQGNDTLGGGQGDDVLRGGLGQDELTGGLGADRFIFASADADVVFGFSPGDVVELSQSFFTQPDALFYDTASGELFYGALLVATFDGAPALAVDDLVFA